MTYLGCTTLISFDLLRSIKITSSSTQSQIGILAIPLYLWFRYSQTSSTWSRRRCSLPLFMVIHFCLADSKSFLNFLPTRIPASSASPSITKPSRQGTDNLRCRNDKHKQTNKKPRGLGVVQGPFHSAEHAPYVDHRSGSLCAWLRTGKRRGPLDLVTDTKAHSSLLWLLTETFLTIWLITGALAVHRNVTARGV